MDKLDLRKQYPQYYSAGSRPEIRSIAAARYLSITGQGDPSSAVYADRVQALFSVAYGVKFAYKNKKQDFVVAKLEGQWWFDEQLYGRPSLHETPLVVPRSAWSWRLLIRMPDFVIPATVQAVKEEVAAAKDLPLALEVVPFEAAAEKVVQMMHVGPFESEPESLAQLLAFIQAHDLEKAGVHHEIYLSDIRRTAPEKWKTILREPVK